MSDLQSEALALADRILALINSEPRTPTREQIADVICVDAMERVRRESGVWEQWGRHVRPVLYDIGKDTEVTVSVCNSPDDLCVRPWPLEGKLNQAARMTPFQLHRLEVKGGDVEELPDGGIAVWPHAMSPIERVKALAANAMAKANFYPDRDWDRTPANQDAVILAFADEAGREVCVTFSGLQLLKYTGCADLRRLVEERCSLCLWDGLII